MNYRELETRKLRKDIREMRSLVYLMLIACVTLSLALTVTLSWLQDARAEQVQCQ